MHSFRVNLSIPGSSDPTPLRSFAHTILFNPMYVDVMDSLKQRPGFIHKTNTLLEGKNNTHILIEIVFDSQEHCELYRSNPLTVNLWEFFNIYAAENGITVTSEVSDKVLDI